MNPGANTLSNSWQLRRKIGLALPKLAKAVHAIRAHQRVADVYPEYLFTLHCVARASVPLMESALGRARTLAATDPIAAKLVPYLEKHIPEEMHAHWLLEDLEVLSWDPAEVLQRLPSPIVAAMVGSQYYWIFHYHPAALLGYMEVAEGYPPTTEQVEDLMTTTGFPRQAFRSLRRHAHLDPEHREELHQTLDDLVLSPELSTVIGASALQTVDFASRAFWEIIERFAEEG